VGLELQTASGRAARTALATEYWMVPSNDQAGRTVGCTSQVSAARWGLSSLTNNTE
jgi:hypothetical protein